MKPRNLYGIHPRFLSENAIERVTKKYDKQERKCLLPGCDNMTKHNGGYCSAEHCKKHRELQRGEKK